MGNSPFTFPRRSCAVILMVASVGIAAEKNDATKSEADNIKPKSVASVMDKPIAKVLKTSRKVDKLIEAALAENKIEPNAPASDEVFVRRVYLDVVGRIPTYDEVVAFLDSKAKDRRSKLIDQLLDSDGYVSHQFNYWADLLRMQSRMRYAPSAPYINFVKDSLRDNKPYDQMVRELISAEGYTWENGAAGYYLRDVGMPLDNMSNTAQVFLGTQLVCAQCHNHPYDSWTQKQYYELAAFTYGVETRDRRTPLYMELYQMRREGKMERNVVQAASQILQPLAYRVHETDRDLRLPDDYQYKDEKPRTTIPPATIFGDDVEVKPGDSRKEIYARWMTSPRNPRFTTVIANRLWKRVFGRGLIEPVDDFKDGIDASNPELMEFLTQQMIDAKYDMKQYLRILLNTKTYQRQVTETEVAEDKTYLFPGPLLTRMSAEQMWDSMVAMIIPQVDQRPGMNIYQRYNNAEELAKKDMKEILAMAEDQARIRSMQFEFFNQSGDLQRKMRVAQRTNNREEYNKLRGEMEKIREKVYGEEGMAMMQRQQNQRRESYRETDPRWAGFSRELVRASEISSPARPGHFLRQFGQSDRETIENANTEATVPQILTLLNGPMYFQLLNRNSVLAKNLADKKDPNDRLDVIFLSLLSRRPTDQEKEMTLESVASNTGTMDVIWSVLNTRQFMFVQ